MHEPGLPPVMHEVPFIASGFEHRPVIESQVPATWHESSGEHVTGLPPVQLPAWHVSVCVHALPSLHAVPSCLFGFEHCPVAWLHVPATWH
jgi:hypothetical protein